MKIFFTPLLFIALFTSCKKQEQSTKYTCTCKVSDNYGYLYTTSPGYSNMSRDEADAQCKQEKQHQENLVKTEDYERRADCSLN